MRFSSYLTGGRQSQKSVFHWGQINQTNHISKTSMLISLIAQQLTSSFAALNALGIKKLCMLFNNAPKIKDYSQSVMILSPQNSWQKAEILLYNDNIKLSLDLLSNHQMVGKNEYNHTG